MGHATSRRPPTAPAAVDAVLAAAGRPTRFGLVLMDVHMPVMSGHAAVRKLRERFDAEALPIVALTAAALVSERDEALAAGMNDFLTKPIDARAPAAHAGALPAPHRREPGAGTATVHPQRLSAQPVLIRGHQRLRERAGAGRAAEVAGADLVDVERGVDGAAQARGQVACA